MDITQVIVVAIAQGLTEFLPVSSSAHLILMPIAFGWKDQGLAFDIAVHVGTLIAVIFYFRKDLKRMWQETFNPSNKIQNTPSQNHLLRNIILATLPIVLVGIFCHNYIAHELRTPIIISISTIVFGILLFFADKKGKRTHNELQISTVQAVIIGCAQAIALIPGTSRSGITITAGLLLGLKDTSAVRFSFLLSIPAITLSGGYSAMKLSQHDAAIEFAPLLLGAFIAGLFAYTTIHFFIKLLDKIGFTPFVMYRLILGGVLLFIFL